MAFSNSCFASFRIILSCGFNCLLSDISKTQLLLKLLDSSFKWTSFPFSIKRAKDSFIPMRMSQVEKEESNLN